MTIQSERQAIYRQSSGTTGTYNEDEEAFIDTVYGTATGGPQEKMIQFMKQLFNTTAGSYDELWNRWGEAANDDGDVHNVGALNMGGLCMVKKSETTAAHPEFDLLTGSETFDRNSDTYVEDFEGLLKEIGNDIVPRDGERVVTNLATSLTTHSITVINGAEYQVTIKGDNLAKAVCSDAFTGTITADGTNRITFDAVKTAASTALTLTITGTLTEVQVELVSGQTIQLASEYAGLNSTQYFNTQNGNTVSSGVVTEAKGSAISASTLKGARDEKTSTNLCLQSEDLGTTWANTWGGGTTLTTNAAVAPDGLTTADEIAQIDGTGDGCQQATTLAAATVNTISGFFKNVDSGQSRLEIYDSNAGATLAHVTFNWTAGVPSTSSSSGASNIQYEALTGVNAGWYRISYSFTTAGTVTTHAYIIFPERGTTATNSIYFWGAVIEASTYPTTYIKTTTGTAQRLATTRNIPTAGNFRSNDIWGVCIVRFPFASNINTGSSWDDIFGSLTGPGDRVHLYKTAGNGKFSLQKKVSGSNYISTTADVAYNANDVFVMGWRISSTLGVQVWKQNVTKSEAVIKDTTPDSNTSDVTLDTAVGFGKDEDTTARSTTHIKEFHVFYGDVPDSVVESKIAELVALA